MRLSRAIIARGHAPNATWERERDMKVGIAGLGAIGRQVCRALDAGIPGLTLAGATARDRERAERFLKTRAAPPPLLDLDDLIAASDLIAEATTQAHLRELAP